MIDAHVRFIGYQESPIEEKPFAPFLEIRQLLEQSGVSGCRQLGTSAEFANFTRCIEPTDELTVSLGGPIVDGTSPNPRLSRHALSPQEIDRAIDVYILEGFDWFPLGANLPIDLSNYAIQQAQGRIRISVEAQAEIGALDLSEVDCVDGLLPILLPAVDTGASMAEKITSLTTMSLEERIEKLRPLLDNHVSLIPLMVATRRQSLLDEIIHAPGIEPLVKILPFHRRLAEMRNPAAFRFGAKHAEKFLQMKRLSKSERKSFESGWEAFGETLAEFDRLGGAIIGGSGAPDAGLCPGIALVEERTVWQEFGIPEKRIDEAFGSSAQQLILGSDADLGLAEI